ncbi:MAG: DUF4442 domain-containing protein [Myxococcota bacterium]
MEYRSIAKLQRFIPLSTLLKYGFNWSPMYRRSSGKICFVSADLHKVCIDIPLSWKNVNYVGTMFGGSMLAATDPIFMVQLINLLGDRFVVWDKSVEMRFRRPARSTLSCVFEFSAAELEEIRASVSEHGEIDWNKNIELTDREGEVVATGTKTLYVADKEYQKQKRQKAAADRASRRAQVQA